MGGAVFPPCYLPVAKLMLKLKLQYLGHLMQRADSLEKTLMLGKIEGGRRRGRQRMDGWMASPTWRTWVGVDSGSWWWTGRPGVLQFMASQRVGHDWATERNWTETARYILYQNGDDDCILSLRTGKKKKKDVFLRCDQVNWADLGFKDVCIFIYVLGNKDISILWKITPVPFPKLLLDFLILTSSPQRFINLDP